MLAGDVDFGDDVSEFENLRLTVPDGVYYLNNRYCGDFLRYNSGTLDAMSGPVSETYLGSKIKWTITGTDNGYTIQSYASPTIYLGVPTNTSSYLVDAVTVPSGTTVPSRCYWDFTTALGSGGGAIVQNKYNLKYLCTYEGTDLSMSASTGDPQYLNYSAKAWRTILSSSYPSRELTDKTAFHDCYLLTGHADSLKYRKAPSNALWANYIDFSYSVTNSSVASINFSTGLITPNSTGSTTVTVHHLPTDREFEIQIKVYPLSTNKGNLSQWANVESNIVGYWDYSPYLYTEKLDSSPTFYFATGCNTAISSWNSALGLSMITTANINDADILVYGGNHTQLESKGGHLEPGVVGLTESHGTYNGYYTYGSKYKMQVKMDTATIYILSNGSSSDRYKNVCTHELGHAVGFFGHSSSSSAVMYYASHDGYTLTTAEKAHLQQIYDNN